MSNKGSWENQCKKLRQKISRLKNVNKRLTIINSALRHDLRNDLFGISGYLEVFQETHNEEVLDKVKQILNKCRHLLEITKHLESMNPVNGKKMKIALMDILNKSLARIKVFTDQVEISIQNQCSDDCKVAADQGLYAVFENVIRNAIDHGDARQIDVTVSEVDAKHIRISITDDGTGIPDKYKEKVFDPKFTTRPQGPHSGLGLFIVKTLVEGYGGSIKLQNTNPQGVTVKIHLPKAS